jgi:hypothetical protein
MAYNEQSRPWFYYILPFIVVVSLIGSIILFVALGVGEKGIFTTVTIGYWLAFGIPIMWFIWLSWAFSIYAIQYDGDFLSFGYLGWSVQLINSEIISAKVVEIKWIKWGGMGWRIKKIKSIGYITSSGPGIEIKTTRKGRFYTFNCQDSQSLLNDLRTASITIENDSAV